MKHILTLLFVLAIISPGKASKIYRDSFSQLATAATLNFTNEVTISVKMYRMANTPTAQGILTKGRSDSINPMLYGLYFNANALRFVYANPDGTFFTYTSSGTFPQTNTTIHVAAKYQYSIASSMKLYVNGELVAGAWDVSPTTVGLVNSHNLILGIINTAAFGIAARVSDVALWNSYLTDNQIRNLYNGPKRTPTTISKGLIAYWQMDNGSEQGGSNPRFQLVDESPGHPHTFIGASGAIISDAFTGYPPNE